MKQKQILLMVIMAAALTGCNLILAQSTPTTIPTVAPTLEFNQPTSIAPPTPVLTQSPSSSIGSQANSSTQQLVLDQAFKIVSALKNKDMATLSQFVNPQVGLRFSPYAYVRETDRVFSAGELPVLLADGTIYAWGSYSGSGEPINLAFSDYFARFVYDEDFASAPQVSLNFRLGVSTSEDNSAEFYAGAMIVEFHFPGFDPAFGGMDWRSLRLVFVQENNNWTLVDIIHDNWTT